MAGITVKGFAELKAKTQQIEMITEMALEAAEQAGAETIRDMVEAAAPVKKTWGKRPVGQLKRSIIIKRGRETALTTTGTRNVPVRLLIGPSKQGGFYGYFVEKGHRLVSRRGKNIRIRRIRGQQKGHSQSGVAASERRVPAHPWFPDPGRIEAESQEAGFKAFDEVLQKKIGG